jgi:hypothetical protein
VTTRVGVRLGTRLPDPLEQAGHVGILFPEHVEDPFARAFRPHEAGGGERLEMTGGAGLREPHVSGQLGDAQAFLGEPLDDAETGWVSEARKTPLEHLTGIHCIHMHIIRRSLTASESVC